MTTKNNAFENAKHIDETGNEYWSARTLQQILEYSEWRNFQRAIDKAITACETSGNDKNHHFVGTNKMIVLGKGGQREVPDYRLSRYACYLIVQNGDPSKSVIAAGQTYFAVQTRRQELQDEAAFRSLGEDKQRLLLRRQLREHNTDLAAAAKDAGVEKPVEYAVFQNHGYRGLYGGLDKQGIHSRKGLKKSQKILDHMNASELAANLFRATQTEEKLRRENIQGKTQANRVHFEVGQKVRQTIEELGGIMPENQPVPEKSIKQLENEEQKRLAATEQHQNGKK
ncbi:TPA: DNA damage-inducible protein D [Neisseria lactamica]|uniref:Putative DNA damage inducible protein n=1 Tax=Neisseria lactamica (strain 020-06) TaxID=489653 RepID=E4ZE36_NEIL0|nr:DNA damage-inducible protein D [Neisseria lactamica]CBN87621.1 putative DNA damage inducible protein [Neisseria lactamica 020-06]